MKELTRIVVKLGHLVIFTVAREKKNTINIDLLYKKINLI